MDSRGHIHELAWSNEIAGKQVRAALEAKVGKVVPIPEAELKTVKEMSVAQRVAWYRDRTTAKERKAARKAQRAARKANRRRK